MVLFLDYVKTYICTYLMYIYQQILFIECRDFAQYFSKIHKHSYKIKHFSPELHQQNALVFFMQ